MSYTIQYVQTKKTVSRRKRPAVKRKVLAAAAILTLAIAARICWPQVGTYAEKILLLGVAEENEAAVTAFFENVGSGDDFSEALTAFCKDVLRNADAAQ